MHDCVYGKQHKFLSFWIPYHVELNTISLKFCRDMPLINHWTTSVWMGRIWLISNSIVLLPHLVKQISSWMDHFMLCFAVNSCWSLLLTHEFAVQITIKKTAPSRLSLVDSWLICIKCSYRYKETDLTPTLWCEYIYDLQYYYITEFFCKEFEALECWEKK